MTKILRIAPSRNGVQMASAWRIWTQGNEFYASVKSTVGIAKISFHSDFNWQYRAGHGVQRLGKPLVLSQHLTSALAIVFLIDADVLIPQEPNDSKITMCETPLGSKLRIDLLLSTTQPPAPNSTLIIDGGSVLSTLTLRSGAFLAVGARILPLNDADCGLMKETRQKLRVYYQPGTPLSGKYVEMHITNFGSIEGNLIGVVPCGNEALTHNVVA